MIIHDCEQRSEAWYALRLGMPTASEFSKIITSAGAPSKSRSGYAISLAAEVYAGGSVDTWGGNVHLERGKTLEEDAIRQYEFLNDVAVSPVGFITDDAQTMGCSPDGMVGDDGMVEVKCLKAENHIEAMLYHQRHGRAPTTYVQQTQGQIWIAERKWCDLIFYHPMLPQLVIRQTPDADVVAGLEVGIPLLLAERDEVVDLLRSA